ncbi:MAG: type II toxin-antitoxin system HicA family toxin [Desulfobaccales bacterium]
MVKLPKISGADLMKALKKAGFKFVRQKGSHVSMQKGPYKTVIPLHEELARGTLLAILKQCGLSKEQLMKYLP